MLSLELICNAEEIKDTWIETWSGLHVTEGWNVVLVGMETIHCEMTSHKQYPRRAERK